MFLQSPPPSPYDLNFSLAYMNRFWGGIVYRGRSYTNQAWGLSGGFEFENNIEVSIELFKEVYRCLKMGGRFVLVANKHLNYKTHLQKVVLLQHTEDSNHAEF